MAFFQKGLTRNINGTSPAADLVLHFYFILKIFILTRTGVVRVVFYDKHRAEPTAQDIAGKCVLLSATLRATAADAPVLRPCGGLRASRGAKAQNGNRPAEHERKEGHHHA